MTKKIEINALDIIDYLRKDGFNSNCEVGVTEFCPYGEGRRIDLFYFNRWDRQTRGYEIKITRADFLADKKWKQYLKFCNWFYFIAPEGVIKKEELPDNIGLIEISVNESPIDQWDGDYYEKGTSKYALKRKFVKRAKKLPDIEESEYIRLLEGLLIKFVYNKNLV